MLFFLHTVRKPPPSLLQFKTMSKRFPWHLVMLLGSGFALAEAFKVTYNSCGLYQSSTFVKTELTCHNPWYEKSFQVYLVCYHVL